MAFTMKKSYIELKNVLMNFMVCHYCYYDQPSVNLKYILMKNGK